MSEPSKEWLASLVPIADTANEYFKGNVEACKRKARVYESLVVVGVNDDLYVDKLRFEHFLYEDMSSSAARKPIQRRDLIRGEETSVKLQEAVRDKTAENYSLLSRIRDLQRQELLESDSEQRKILSNAIVELEVKRRLVTKAMHEAESKFSDFMTEYGSKPENVRPKREVVEKKVVQSDAESGKVEKRKRMTGIERAAKAKAKAKAKAEEVLKRANRKNRAK